MVFVIIFASSFLITSIWYIHLYLYNYNYLKMFNFFKHYNKLTDLVGHNTCYC